MILPRIIAGMNWGLITSSNGKNGKNLSKPDIVPDEIHEFVLISIHIASIC